VSAFNAWIGSPCLKALRARRVNRAGARVDLRYFLAHALYDYGDADADADGGGGGAEKRLQEAEELCREVVSRDPNYAVAWSLLGQIAAARAERAGGGGQHEDGGGGGQQHSRGRLLAEADSFFRRAIAIYPAGARPRIMCARPAPPRG
jgi:hypothetical protein